MIVALRYISNLHTEMDGFLLAAVSEYGFSIKAICWVEW